MKDLVNMRFAVAALLAGASVGWGRQTCSPEWLRGDGLPGFDGNDVQALTDFDPDGTGPQPPQLIAGGMFTTAGGIAANNISRWDGASWQALGAGMNGNVISLTTFDPDGDGPQPSQLIAGGAFTTAGGVAANHIARWDGSTLQTLGTGVSGQVNALTSFDPDGAGPQQPQLIAAGRFTIAGGVAANYVARWDGATWQPLGTGVDNDVYALASFDPDGDGPLPPQLIAGGAFTTAGGVNANYIARWDGSAWQPLGTGMDSFVQALSIFDFDGTGPQPPQLVAGGGFFVAGGVGAGHIARWGGSAWQAIGPTGTGMDATVLALTTFDPDGTGPQTPQLIAGGDFTIAGTGAANRIAKWNGTAWQPLAAGTNEVVKAVAPFDPDGSGPQTPQLIAAGRFTTAGGVAATRIASWGGTAWKALWTGMNERVITLTSFDPDGTGSQPPQLIAGGLFTSAGSIAVNRIARWDGNMWQALGTGLNDYPVALTTFDPDGGGFQTPQLIAGGFFTNAGGVAVNSIASWSGTAWQALGTGMNGYVYALTSFDPDDAGGSQPPQLIAGGQFTTAGGVAANNIARWNGSGWQALRTGVNAQVTALATFDPDGNGGLAPRLIVGGVFDLADGSSAKSIASWNGNFWTNLGTGMNDYVYALTSFDPDGTGPLQPQLIAGGGFTTAGGQSRKSIARWDGSQWLGLGAGMPDGSVYALTTFDPDDAGPLAPQLIAAGNFYTAGGVAARGIARWDGNTWQALGTGVSGGFEFTQALTTFDPDGTGGALSRLCVGGGFTLAGGNASAFFAEWGQDTALWRTASSGTYGASGNWLCNLPPTIFDRLIIDNTQAGYAPSAFQVTLPIGSGPSKARTMSCRTDTVTLELNGNPFTLTGGAIGVDDPGLVVGELPSQPGALILKNSSGGAHVDFTTTSLSLADQPTSAARLNELTVQDAATRLVINGSAFIGRRGNEGRLTVQSGGDAVIGGALSVADQVGSVGRLAVTGAGSTLLYGSAGTSAGIGVNGTATLDISSGGLLLSSTFLSNVTVGTLAGGLATVNITGAGSTWSTGQNNFAIGYAGDVAFGINSGGQLLTQTATDVYVSRYRESLSTVTIRDAGSRWREEGSPIRIGPSGTINVGPGAAIECAAMMVTEGGLLTGEGLVTSLTPGIPTTVQNGGEISPASTSGAPSILTIDGNLTQSASRDGITTAGTLGIDLASATQSDRIDLTGTATLSGALQVRLAPGFDPPEGSRFTVLTAQGGITGRFDVAYFPGLDGRLFRIEYLPATTRSSASVDIVVESQSERGNFNGSTYSAPGAPSAAALDDLNADGFPDLVLTIPDAANPETNPGQVAVLINAGNSGNTWNGFTPSSQVTINTGILPSSVAIGRFRGPAQPPDLAIACAGANTIQLFSNSGAAIFSSAGTISSGGLRPLAVRAADLNNNGSIDLAVANYGDINPPPEVQLPDRGNARVILNNGAGTFTLGSALVTGWYPRDLALIDLDSDGVPDIATANSGTSDVTTLIYRPAQPGGYNPPVHYPSSPRPIQITPGGLDHPKDLDTLIVSCMGNSPSDAAINILRSLHNANGDLAPAVALDVEAPPRATTVLDLDADADGDLAVLTDGATPGSTVVRLLRNNTPANGSLVLALEPTPLTTNNPSLILAGDVDQDGLDDLVALNSAPGAFAARGGKGPDRDTTPRVLVARATAPPPACPADINGDHTVNTADLTLLLGHFGTSVTPNTSGDLNGDGFVNTADLTQLLGAFGSTCP